MAVRVLPTSPVPLIPITDMPEPTARVSNPSAPVSPSGPTCDRANIDGSSPASGASAAATGATSEKHQVKKVGDYVLGATIGEGTFGKVRLGTHTKTNEKVAIKILEREKIQGDEDWNRVKREISILQRIRHPHVIQLYEILQTHDQLLLIMEYASGGELFDYIVAQRKVKEREACKFFHQILAGVEKIHQMGVVHRDLKPENLLLDEYRNIKIVDFGLSNTYHAGQSLKTACGSPQYAAPEMLAGHHYEPGGSDVWSCGVVLYAMICGHLPFEDRDTARLYGKILKGDYELPRCVSEGAADLIRGMLTVRPEQRLQIHQIRQHPWYQHFQVMDPERPPRLSEGGHSSSCELVSRFFSWLASCERCRNWRELELIQLDDEVLDECARLWKLSRRDIVSQLQQNKHNGVTTTFYLLDKRRHCYRQKLMQAAGLPGGAIPSSVAQSYGGGIQARATTTNNDPRSKAVPATGRPATHTQPPSGVDSPRTPPIRGNRSVAYGPFAADRAHRGHHQQLEQQPSLSPCCSFSPCCFPKQPAATGTFRSHAGASIPPSLMPLLPPTGYSVVPPHVATYASAPSTARGVQTRPPVMAQVTGQGGGDNVTHMYSPPLQLSGSPGSAPIPQPHHIADGREQPAGEPSAKMRALLDVDESQVVRVGGGVGVGGLPGELCGGEAASDTDEALELRPALAEETPCVVEEGEEDRPSPAPRPRTSEQPAGEPAGGPSLSAAMRDLLGSDESQVVKVAGGARVMNTARPKARGPAPPAANCAQPQPFGGRLDEVRPKEEGGKVETGREEVPVVRVDNKNGWVAKSGQTSAAAAAVAGAGPGPGVGVGGGSIIVPPLSISSAATNRRPFAEAPMSARVCASKREDPLPAAPQTARGPAPLVQHTYSPAHVLCPVVQAARIAQPLQSTYYHHHPPSPVPFPAINVNPKIATPPAVRAAVVAPAPSGGANGANVYTTPITSAVNSPIPRPFIPQSPAAKPTTQTPTVLPHPPQQATTSAATAVYRTYLNANVHHQYPPAAAYHAYGVSPRVSRITPPPAPRVSTQWYYPSPMPSPRAGTPPAFGPSAAVPGSAGRTYYTYGPPHVRRPNIPGYANHFN